VCSDRSFVIEIATFHYRPLHNRRRELVTIGALAVKTLAYTKSIIKGMKAHVYVTLKRTVLDAQGQTVADALRRMNYRGVSDVRQGKYFLLTLEAPATDANTTEAEGAARAEVDRIAREVLVNPVIEEYTFRLEA